MYPLVAITIGDPAGIGPEIVVRSLNKSMIYDHVRPLVIGSKKILERIAPVVDNKMKFHIVKDPKEGKYTYGTIDVLDIDNVNPKEVPLGVISGKAGQAVYDYIQQFIFN